MNTDTLFALLRETVTGQPAIDKPTEGVGVACRVAKAHDLLHLLGGAADTAWGEEILQAQWQAMYRAERFTYELDRLSHALEAAQVRHIPLKGAVLRHAYPDTWMRTSCDMDILIQESDLERVSTLFTDTLSLQPAGKGTHDRAFFTESGLHIELHYSLIEDGLVKNAGAILSRVWEVSRPVEGAVWRLQMPDELFYFYHVAHLAKHVLGGGCGIRPLLDLWVLRHRVVYDASARQALIDEGDLTAFEAVAVGLSEVWFSAGAHDDRTEPLETYILRGGTYGNEENRLLTQHVAKGGRGKYILSRVFASYETLCVYYPEIKGRRWLVPYGQVRRWCRLLLPAKRKRSLQEWQTSRRLEEDPRATSTAQMLKDLGL